jgi:outer membrane protein assembly factor BamB
VTRRRWILVAAGVCTVLLVAAGVLGAWWYHEKTAAKEVRGSATVEFTPNDRPELPDPSTEVLQGVAWPTYGYDNRRTHLSPFDHRPPYRRLWRLRTRWFIEFPPAVGYGKVFVSQLRGVFYAVDAKTGEWRWRRKFPFCSASSPALARGLVIETFLPTPCTRGPRGVPGLVIAMRESDGKTVWSLPIASESSPLVAGGLVYFGAWDHKVYAVDIDTGKVVWATETDGEINSSPAFADGTVYIGTNSGSIFALDGRSGDVRWTARSFSNFARGREYFYATPTVAYGRVFASNTDGTVYAFGAGTGNLLWARRLGTYVYTAPAVWNQNLYAGTYDGKFYALDAATGDTRWVTEMPAAVHGAPTVMGGLVYLSTCGFCGQKGSRGAKRGPNGTYALDALTGKLVWQFPDGQYSPVVADDERVYVVGATRVYALESRVARTPSP